MDKNNFFTKVNVPTFDSNYASSFEQFVETINNNFTRIASLPFLKGDNGSSIIIHKERLYDDRDKFTEFGILLVKAIYKELADSSFSNFDELKTVLHTVYPDSEPINGIYSCGQLRPEKTSSIPVYYDQYTGEKHLCVPYIFQDSRKNALQGHYLTTYVDQTKYVIGDSYKKDEGIFIWRFETSDFIPSLYYDEDNSMYCWSINGEKSGITAQGVDGKDGNNGKSWLCKGEYSHDYTDYIKITTVFTDTYDSVEQNVGESGIAEGDLAVVAFLNSEEENDVLFGPVIVVTGDSPVYLVKISGNNLLSIENTNDFHTLMKSAGKSSAGQNDVLGLYTFGRTKEYQNQANQDSPRIPHMFWVDEEENTAHIAPVTVDNTLNNPERNVNSDLTNTNIKLEYDTLETNNSSISKNTFDKEFDINGSQYVIVPSTNIKVNDFKGVSMIQTGSLNNIRTAKNIDMSIDLPSLGIKTKAGEIICIDKIRHLVGNGTNPLDISLELTELNCNWNNDDNTSWGGRSYYDVDLFASSATFNENNSQAVYVGTTETPIKATIESKDYFANLQISVIRYDVAFDDEDRPLNVRGFYELNNTTKKTDLVLNSDMLLDGIKSIGEQVTREYPLNGSSTITCSTTVSSIKTYTDVVVYLKPYSDDETNDLFYLLNPESTSPEFEHIFWDEPTAGVAEPIFKTSYYTCLRLRFKDEEGGKLVLSHLNDNGTKPCDLNDLTEIADIDKITYNKNKVEINGNTFTLNFENISNGKLFDQKGQEFSCYVPLNTNMNNNERKVSKITKDFNSIPFGINALIEDFSYLDNKGEVKVKTIASKAINKNNFSNPDDLNSDFNSESVTTIYYITLPEDCDMNYYFGNSQTADRKIYGILDSGNSKMKFYFFDTHLGDTKYDVLNEQTPIGLNNKYYHILNSGRIPLSTTENTQSLQGLGITSDNINENVYSIKFNDFKWNIGTFNTTFVRYNSGIGCGKLLPFPKYQYKNTNIQHTVLDNSPWYLTLSKSVSDTELFKNVYTDFVFDKSNGVILSNNYVERLLPNGVNCYYLGDLYLNNEPILTNSITEFEIQEFSKDNESNSNSNISSPGTQEPPSEALPELPSEVLPELPENPGVANPS